MAKCAFCGKRLVKGSGMLFVRRDGSAQFFCGSKCQKNALRLRRSPYGTKWTEFYQKEKQAEKKLREKKGEERPKAARKRKKSRKKKKKKR